MVSESTTYVNSHSSLRVRTEAAELFLSELARGIPKHERVMVGYADEATVQADADGKKLNAGWWPKPWTANKGISTNNNCYVCISSSIETLNEKTGRMRYWRGDSSFGHGLALMVDDIGSGRGSKGDLTVEALSVILPPTAVVETSPGNHQLWYFLASPEPNKILFKGLLTSFVDAVLKKGGDSTIRDISRYGRMPVGYNNKRVDGRLKYDMNGKPFDVHLNAADYSRRYTVYEIAKAFGFVINVTLPKALTANEIAERVEELPLNRIWLEVAVKVLAGMGEGSGGDVTMNGSGKYRIKCPWGDEHTNGDPYGAYFRGPVSGAEHEYVFGCAHDSCRKQNRRTWAAFIDKIVMPHLENELERTNRAFS
jgi:hypothetical protein